MVTGASTANLAILLIDVRHGVIEQTKRHAFIASLLQIPHDYSEDDFNSIKKEFENFSSKLEILLAHLKETML